MLECYTYMRIDELEYQWTINKFSVHLECSKYQRTNRILKSASFSLGNNDSDWHLEMRLHGFEDKYNEYIGVHTYYENSKESPLWASQEYYFIDSNNRKILIVAAPMYAFVTNGSGYGFHRFYEKKKLLDMAKEYLPNDELTIYLKLGIMSKAPYSRTNLPLRRKKKKNLLSDIGKLLIDDKFADITFILNDVRIKAHKAILAIRSPVFAAMFDNEMIEQGENEVNIVDIDHDIFKKMLQFIYTCDVDDLDEFAMDLLVVADKYQMDDLKEMCEHAIHKNMTVENASEILVMSDRHDGKRLFKCTLNFMSVHILDVLKTDGYKMIEEAHPKLAAQLLRNLVMDAPRDEETGQ